MKKFPAAAVSLAFMLAGSFSGAWAARPDTPMADEVKAVFQKNCAVCHKGKFPPRNLNLEPGSLPASVVDVPSTEQADLRLVDTAAPESSYLLKKIRGAEGISGKRMPPPSRPAPTADELAVIESWIMGLKAPDAPEAKGWGFGVEKRIGLHVFQVFAANSIGLTSSRIVTGGDLRLAKGDFRFGFNIFRTF